MFTKRHSQRLRAWTLVEMMIAVGIFSIASAALGTLFMFSIKSFAQMANYAILDQENRHAVDILTREIRQASYVESYSTNPTPTITLRWNTSDITYSFDPVKNTMTRTVDGNPQILLTNCSLLNFTLYQRSPKTNDFEIYEIANNNVQKYVKAIELTWRTRKRLNPTSLVNSENVQTARIIIRKQQED